MTSLDQRIQRGWASALWFAVLALSSLTLAIGADGGEILDELGNSRLADQNVKAALEVLRGEISQTREKLPPVLVKELDQAVAARLKALQQSVGQHLTPEYTRAMLAKRILELAEHVVTLPYRKIPADAEQRILAQKQYGEALDRFEKLAADTVKQMPVEFGRIVIDSLRPVLTEVQDDLFRAGYGQPLNADEQTALKRIVEGILQAAAGLPAVADNGDKAGAILPKAAKVANDGRMAVLAFLRRRESSLAKDATFLSTVKAWHKKHEALEKTIDGALKEADRAEINAVIERARLQGEQDRLENDPKEIERRQRLRQH